LLSLQLSAVPAAQAPLWQVSAPLHRLPSAHEVPLATGMAVQPKMESQPSVVHGLPSLQLSAVPAVQAPLWQVSAPLQTLPSLHEVPFSTGALTQPVAGLQLSVVHTFPSLQLSGVPAVHTPLWQISLPLQTLPSAQEVPLATGVVVQPNVGLQLSVVHGLPSLQARGVPAVHTPLWQVSAPSQTSASGQGVPLSTAALAQPVVGLQPSVVHGLPSLQSRAVPAAHAPPWQISTPLQTFPSEQDEPFGAGVV
jgi:hypothetical protein